MELDDVRLAIRRDLPHILDRFWDLSEHEPWIKLPRGFRFDHLGELAIAATDLALTANPDKELLRRVIDMGSRHGQDRLAHGFSESLVFQEQYLLRHAIWRYLSEEMDAKWPNIPEAIVRIDSALSVAVRASIRGFHRPSFEHVGRWETAFDDLVDEWHDPSAAGGNEHG